MAHENNFAEKRTEQGDRKNKAPLNKSEKTIWESIIIFSGYLYPPLWGFISLLLGIVSWRVNLKRNKKIAKGFLITGIVVMILHIIVVLVLHFYFIKPSTDDAYLSMQMDLLLTLILVDMNLEEDNSTPEVLTCKNEKIASICERIEQLTGQMPTFHHNEDTRTACAYVKVSENNYNCIDKKVEFTQSSTNSSNTSVFPGQDGYCDGETFSCPIY